MAAKLKWLSKKKGKEGSVSKVHKNIVMDIFTNKKILVLRLFK